jgi:ABC-type transport system involved in cytochrome bd biosynthesis fused ATPase/permease subunit
LFFLLALALRALLHCHKKQLHKTFVFAFKSKGKKKVLDEAFEMKNLPFGRKFTSHATTTKKF